LENRGDVRGFLIRVDTDSIKKAHTKGTGMHKLSSYPQQNLWAIPISPRWILKIIPGENLELAPPLDEGTSQIRI